MPPVSPRRLVVSCLTIGSAILSACSADSHSTFPSAIEKSGAPRETLTKLDCVADVGTASIDCKSAAPSVTASGDIIGGQNLYLKVTSSGVVRDVPNHTLTANVTVQNLLNEAIGTPNGVLVDTAGIKVFFQSGPTVTAGTGTVTVTNYDGVDTFTGASQPYFKYSGILTKNQVSASKVWTFDVPATVTSFSFGVLVSTSVQPLIVINEVLANPGGTITDSNGEWFELYNAGTRSVDLQGFFVRDSVASGIRPVHAIASSLIVPAGGYVVLGNTTNTIDNGGTPVDYAYGAALALANSTDAIRIERLWGTDTLFIDGISYASGLVSAQNGISRELKNPTLVNNNMDGSNWTDASVLSVYGPVGRGTPKAQNSGYVP